MLIFEKLFEITIVPNIDEIPNAPRTLMMLEPIMLPSKTFSALFFTEAKVTANSGRDVPIAASVSPRTASGIP